MSEFLGQVVKCINLAKECGFQKAERTDYAVTLMYYEDLSRFYDRCFLAIVKGYQKRDVTGAVSAALGYVGLIKQVMRPNKKIVEHCVKTEKCLEKYGAALGKAKDPCPWFYLDVLLANIVDFSEMVMQETADEKIRDEMAGLLLRVRHMRVLLPQKVAWDERISREKVEAAARGTNLMSEGSAEFLEISIFRLVYAARATFPREKHKGDVKLDEAALLNILRTPQLLDFCNACFGIISAKASFKGFEEKARAVVGAMALEEESRDECTRLVFPKGNYSDFFASDYSRGLFLFERVLGGFVVFLNGFDGKNRDPGVRPEVYSFRLLLLALIVLYAYRGAPRR